MSSGVRHSAILTWLKAARWHGLTWAEFGDLEGDRQSFVVASYMTVMQTEAVEVKEAGKNK